MTTTATKPPKVLSTAQLEWLKTMGAALGLGAPATSAGTGEVPPAGVSAESQWEQRQPAVAEADANVKEMEQAQISKAPLLRKGIDMTRALAGQKKYADALKAFDALQPKIKEEHSKFQQARSRGVRDLGDGADQRPDDEKADGADKQDTGPADPNAAKYEKEILKVGCKGLAVEHLQKQLNANGANLEIDGKFGPKTQQAVKDFQKSKGLGADGVVGPKTWGALSASKPEPPKPPDTKPRRVVVTVTDEATNDAVRNATVKISNQSEKTGNTGQATLSLPPGKYPFGVTAEGYEQAIGTLDVTSNDETQLRVELKGGKHGSKTVLTVAPAGQSKEGQSVVLTATVTMGNANVSPSGTVRFDVVLNAGGGGRLTLAKVPVKDGKANHTESKLPKGSHLLDAAFTPDAPGQKASQSDPVKHDVSLDKKAYEQARKAAMAKYDDCMVSAREFKELKKEREELDKKKKEMETAAKAENYEKAKQLANELATNADEYLKKSAAQEEKYKKQGENINKQLDGASESKRGEVAAKIANDLKGKSDEIKFMPTKVRNRLLAEMQKGGLTDDEKKAHRVLYSETYLDAEFEKIDKENQEKMFDALKGDKDFKEARSKWGDAAMTAAKKLAILQKVCDHQAKAYGFPPGKVEGYDRTKEPSRPKYGYYSHKDGKMYVNIEKAVLTDEGIDEAIDTAVHEHAHRYQSWLVDRLDGKEKPELKEGDPLYDQAVTFKLNDTQKGFYVFDGAEYSKQPKEHHSRLTHDKIKDAGIGK